MTSISILHQGDCPDGMRVNIQASSMAVLPMCNSGGNERYRRSGFRMPQTAINAQLSSPYGGPSYAPDSHKRTTLKSMRTPDASKLNSYVFVWPEIVVLLLLPLKNVLLTAGKNVIRRPRGVWLARFAGAFV